MTSDMKDFDWRLRVFDSLSYPTRVLAPDGTIVAVNQRYIEKIDSMAESTIGQKWQDVNQLYQVDEQSPRPIDCV